MTNEPPPDWHAQSVDDVIARVDGQRTGLPEAEAARRLTRFGPNATPAPSAISALGILRAQLASVVVGLLAAATVLSIALGDVVDAAAIAAVLVLNATLGFVTEFRARRAMEALRRFDVSQASVVRDGQTRRVEGRVLVPGDLVELRAGETVPADGRLLTAVDLRTAEAALTGESLPIAKDAAAVVSADTPLADRTNLVFKGTIVVGGMGRAIVFATGAATEIGRVGMLVADIHAEQTPLERRLDALGKRLVWLALAVAAIVATIEAAHGTPLNLVVQTGLALAVAAVPEGLPAVVTIALAVGLARMARRQALVRRLPAVEALGSTTVVCTDKTRTLTSGDMTVVRVWADDTTFDLRHPSPGTASPALAHAIGVASLASTPGDGDVADAVTDPVDRAIIQAAIAHAPPDSRTTQQPAALLPFSSASKLMAGFFERDGRLVAFVKGAPGTLLERSTRVWTPSGPRPLDGAEQGRLHGINETLAAEGLRVLALASGPVAKATDEALQGLEFVGFVGLMDPPAPGVAATIARLREAGLRTVMLTGDQQKTAEAVGRELKLLAPTDRVLDERELRALTPADRATAIAGVGAFSRVAPEDKLSIVAALQARGEIVAMLGDGVNDAPALKRADVGVAMGIRGTDVAREAADIVLKDDRFETIAAAVEEGRVIADNIRKCVFYLFSCNLAEVLVLLGAALAGLPVPLRPLQILWLNLVTDTFPALSLALEPADVNVMRRPPADPREAILSPAFLRSVALHGVLITLSTLAAFVWALTYAPDRAETVTFMTLALAQISHLGNARSHAALVGRAHFSNPYAMAAVVLTLGLQALAVGIDSLATALDIAPLGRTDWAVVIAFSIVPGIVGQAMRMWRGSGRQKESVHAVSP